MNISKELKKQDRRKKRDMTRNERVVAHYIQGMELSKDDEAYRLLLEEANKVQLAGKSRQYTAAYLKQQYGVARSKAYKVITDAIEVFGDVNKSSREGLRYLQTEWYTRMADRLENSGEFELAIKCRERIDKINGLEDRKGNVINIKKVVQPKSIIFSTDPKALAENRRIMEAEEAEYEEMEE
ncbi:MAG: hypothetical protein AAFZ15_06810 [Bacteroidota bacterium]